MTDCQISIIEVLIRKEKPIGSGELHRLVGGESVYDSATFFRALAWLLTARSPVIVCWPDCEWSIRREWLADFFQQALSSSPAYSEDYPLTDSAAVESVLDDRTAREDAEAAAHALEQAATLGVKEVAGD